MNNNGQQGGAPDPNNALAFLAQAADRENQQRQGRDNAAAQLEQLLMQRQQASQYAPASSHAFLGQLQDQNLLAQLQQQHQLSQLLGGYAGMNTNAAGLRSALLGQGYQAPGHAQPSLSEAEIISLIRSGASPAMISSLVGDNAAYQYGAHSQQMMAAASAQSAGGIDLQALRQYEELQRAEAMRQLEQQQLMHQQQQKQQQQLQNQQQQQQQLQLKAQQLTAAAEDDDDESPPQSPVHAQRKMTGGDGRPPIGDSTREEIEKAPGSVIVPCRARGMPMDHNFKTAYFVIPENVRHGEELICSYYACRNAGIKFRYCSHCKVPVAKRNFRKRHKHGSDDLGPDEDSEDDEYPPPPKLNKKGIPSSIMASNRESIAEADGISSQSNDSSNQRDKFPTAAAAAPLPISPSGAILPNAEAVVKPTAVTTTEIVLQNGQSNRKSEKEERWIALLKKRPLTNEGEAMSAWLMEVLVVSDPDAPRDNPEENQTAEVRKRKAEDELLVTSSDAMEEGEITKKQSDEVLTKEEDQREKASFVSGSFAEWKERKKQKKQQQQLSDSEEK